ncbi:MAG TPA: glycine/sarcosine/betaine reductase component B subunit [Candidatus Binatia bacterium]|nr:glycine/sarcosine/betaine reductase component B subunit [Candidatus Binatia bacterium]
MLLELADFPVSRLRIAQPFGYEAAVLTVDPDELTDLLRQDQRIDDVSFDVVHPGDQVRITGIRDIVEPRVKVTGQGQVFPGTLTPVQPVGSGRTHRLSGMAVVATAVFEGAARAGLAVQRSAILDMWGPGAEATRFAKLAALVLTIKLQIGLSDWDAHCAIQTAELKVARRLAEVTRGLIPERVETFDYPSSATPLPRVALIQGCLTNSQGAHSNLSYYGMLMRESLTTVIPPGELLDGAVAVCATRAVAYFPLTWDWQNHPLVMGLLREHGKRVDFVGVILERIQFDTFHGKEVIAHNTATLAKQLEAHGAIFAWTGSGNAFVDVMLTIQACERRGICTTLITYEFGGKAGTDSPLLYYAPEALAVVSTGSRDRWLELPAPERVVGPYQQFSVLSYPGAPLADANGELTLDARDMIAGGVDNWGRENWRCELY